MKLLFALITTLSVTLYYTDVRSDETFHNLVMPLIAFICVCGLLVMMVIGVVPDEKEFKKHEEDSHK